MNNKELKKLMTKVAKGEISKEEADRLIKQEKMHQDKPKQESKGNLKDHTHKRKKSNKTKEVK